MKMFSFFRKKDRLSPQWSIQLHGEFICYNGEDISDFLKKFDYLEDHVVSLWDINKVSWKEYQKMIAEIHDAKQLFVRFAYN